MAPRENLTGNLLRHRRNPDGEGSRRRLPAHERRIGLGNTPPHLRKRNLAFPRVQQGDFSQLAEQSTRPLARPQGGRAGLALSHEDEGEDEVLDGQPQFQAA